MAATKVLNVAEKNDVAKTISEMLARGRYNRRDGASVYNKIYEFPFQVDRKRDGKFFSQNGQRLIDQLQTSVVNWSIAVRLWFTDGLKPDPTSHLGLFKTSRKQFLTRRVTQFCESGL